VRDLVVGDLLDGYRVEAALARGGMASIFRAVDEASGDVVALKVPHLRYEADVVFYDRFRREEEIALRLDHPNLVRALPPRRERTRVYLVLEYVAGVSLAQRLRERGALPPDEALELARQTCEALVYLHGHGIAHHDVKPENVVLTAEGRVKLLDLGVAHLETARRLTVSGLSASIGTPDYMAPEQLRGRAGDARADLFALGTMLYELLTGRLPYAGADWEERLRAKRLEDPTPPSAHLPGLSPALDAVVMRAIQPAVADRYQAAADLLADLRSPPAVAPGAPPRRPGRRRVDLRLLGAVAAIVAGLSLVGGAAWLGHRRGIEAVPSAAAPASAAPPRAAAPR
jgi:serine/threonine-protein kinase